MQMLRFKKILPLLMVGFMFFSFLFVQGQGITIPDNTGLPDGSVTGVLTTVLNWLLMVFVIIATISFVITGLQFIFSFGGASGSEAQAKKNFSYTIIAIFIVGGSLIILKTIVGLLGPSSGGNSGSGINYGTEQNPNYGTIDDNYDAVGGMMNPKPINQHDIGGYPDNDAGTAEYNANNGTVLSPGQTDTDASHEADNPTQNEPSAIDVGGYPDNDAVNN
jgi:hypothetical protein